MEAEGPRLEALTHRLAECPADFLREPRIGDKGDIDVTALVADHLRSIGIAVVQPADIELLRHRDLAAGANRWRLISLAVWLLHDEWFQERRDLGPLVLRLLTKCLDQLAAVVPADQFVTEPDRREELVRHCLKELNLRPQGESVEQAADRLTSLDSAERARIIRQTRDAESRAREVREMMARRAAEEAAAKASRE